MLIKKKFLFPSILSFALGFFASCTDSDHSGPNNDDPENVDIVLSDDDHGLTYNYPAIIVNVGGELETALRECLPNVVGSIDENTRLIILGNLNDIPFEDLEAAFYNGATIAVAFPKSSDLKAFNELHPDMMDFMEDPDIDDAILYSFSNAGHHFLVENEENFDAEPNSNIEYYEEEIIDDGVENEEEDSNYTFNPEDEEMTEFISNHNDYYHFISGWIFALNAAESSLDVDGDSEGQFFAPENIYQSTFNFKTTKKEEKLRQVPSAKTDTLPGTGTMAAIYKIRQIHVYQGNAGAGDYYIMEMIGHASHSKMWRGNTVNKHGEIYTKICGWYCTSFRITARLLDENYKEVNVTFASAPTPATQSAGEEVAYTSSSSVDVGFSLSVAGGWKKKDGKHGGNASAKAEVSSNWSWSRSESYKIKNSGIINHTSVPSVGWGLTYMNLPEWNKHDRKIIDYGNQSYNGLGEFTGRWVWYQPDMPDNVERKSYYIETSYEIEYSAVTHVYSTTKKHNVHYSKVDTIEIKAPMVTQTVGMVYLTNNLEDKYVRRVEIYNTETGEIIAEDYESISPDEKRYLGAIYTNQKCSVRLQVHEPGGSSDETYVYDSNSSLPLRAGADLNLSILGDFRKE